jgi:hypothetical protein
MATSPCQTIERIGGAGRGSFQKLPVGGVGVVLLFRLQQRRELFGSDLLAGLLRGFLEDWILDDLLSDHLLQFQPVKLKDGDHLY